MICARLDPAAGGESQFEHVLDAGESRRVPGHGHEVGEAGRAEPLEPAGVKAYATAGEIVKALRAVFGTYVEDPVF